MDMYAYDVPQEFREDLVPNLRIAAEQPWMGLTAYISNQPHLIIGKLDDSTFIIENQQGKVSFVDYAFPWEEPKVESNRLVAASRNDESPFKDAGLLAYDDESGEWAVRVGISNMRYPLEDHIASLEENGWRLSFENSDVTVEVHGRCPHCGSDSLTYADEDEIQQTGLDLSGAGQNPGPSVSASVPIADSEDRVVLCHSCHQWSMESELATDDDRNKDNEDQKDDEPKPDGPDGLDHDEEHRESSVKTATEAFTFQGALVIPGQAEGVAIKPDEGNDAMLGVTQTLQTPDEQHDQYIQNQNKEHGTNFPRYDNPFVNRGASFERTALDTMYPEQFHGGTFILAAKWLTPEHTVMFLGEQGKGIDPRFKGIITSSGGATSHAVVVARGNSLPCIITDHDNVDRIQPGDHLEILSNGVVHVNGGDPSFVAQDPSNIKAKSGVYRWVWSQGHGATSKIDPADINKPGTLHPDLIQQLFAEGKFDFMNSTLGYLYDDGSVDEDVSNHITDQEAFESWIRHFGKSVGIPVTQIHHTEVAMGAPVTAGTKYAAEQIIDFPPGGIHNQTSALFANNGVKATVHLPNGPVIQLPFTSPMMFMQIMKWRMQDYPQATAGGDPVGAPVRVESDNLPLAISLIHQAAGMSPTASTDHREEALKCPQCGSHTVEAMDLDEHKGKAEFLCQTCGNTFKDNYRRTAGSELPKGTRIELTHPDKKGYKGSIADHSGTDDNFGDELYDILLDNGEELTKVPETHFKKIKSASIKEAINWMEVPECPNCGSKSSRHTVHEDLASGNAQCLDCGHEYEFPVRITDDPNEKTALNYPEDPNGQDEVVALMRQIVEAHAAGDEQEVLRLKQQLSERLGAVQKGAPYPSDSYKNAPDHTPKDQKKDWPEEVNAIYNACMREGNGDKEKCAKIAWSTYKKNDGHPKDSDKNKESAWKEADGTFGDYFDENAKLHRSLPLPYDHESTGMLICPECQGNNIDIMSGRCMNCGAHYSPGTAQTQPEDLGNGAHQQRSTIPIGWENDKHRWESRVKLEVETAPVDYPGYEGHPVMCYMCGNQRSASLGSGCEHCGYPLMIRRDGPPASKKWASNKECDLCGHGQDRHEDQRDACTEEGCSCERFEEGKKHSMKSASLSVGEWYTMHSPEYKVPDVIHVNDVTDEGITASIEGDDKGLFPIELRHNEIEEAGYRFEPYTPHVEHTNQYFLEEQNVAKEARRNFSGKEQQDLVNENLSGRARNMHKMNLDGTHYPSDFETEASVEDILYGNAPFFLW